MSHLRTLALVLIALFVPGGLIVLVPTIHRLFVELRDKRRARSRLVPAK